MKLIAFTIFASLFSVAVLQTAAAEKLLDPDKVAPEFREAAAKRRSEQIKMMDCNKKAEEAKVLPRDRASHVQHCLDAR
jgi:hypothetical protein